jgi:acetyltransferase-like isoleucine patch superfamily enzyme
MLLKKIINRIWKRPAAKPKLEKVQYHPSTIFLPGTKTDFRIGAADRPYVQVGKNGLIKATFTFETQQGLVQLGNNVHIGGAHFICRSGVTVGDDVTMAWGITIYDHDSHSIYWEHRKNDNNQCYADYVNTGNNIVNKDWSHVNSKPIIIENKVWIGFGVTILKGVTVGEGAVVAAHSVVTKNVPPYTVVAGNPAKVVKQIQ